MHFAKKWNTCWVTLCTKCSDKLFCRRKRTDLVPLWNKFQKFNNQLVLMLKVTFEWGEQVVTLHKFRNLTVLFCQVEVSFCSSTSSFELFWNLIFVFTNTHIDQCTVWLCGSAATSDFEFNRISAVIKHVRPNVTQQFRVNYIDWYITNKNTSITS